MYTIQFLDRNDFEKRNKVIDYIRARLIKEGVFNATLTPSHNGKYYTILVKPVRLVKAKPYCGNHPGECQINPFLGPQKKKSMTLLEWDDWVKFHNLVNRCLNRFKANANVWSNPPDVRGKMWIRKGLKARVRYDWDEKPSAYGNPIRVWNTGSDDQFIKNKLSPVDQFMKSNPTAILAN